MKLLEKQEINKSVQAERKAVIDSGIILAKKVDILRHELPALEKQRADFIASSKETIASEIKDLRSEKGILAAEIKEATKTLSKLREPLDAEWKALELEKDEVLSIKTDSELFFQSIITERNELAQEKQLIAETKEIIQFNDARAYRMLREIEEDRMESKKLRQEAQSLKESKEVELYSKEQGLLEKEKNLEARELILKKERLEFNKEKKLLALKKQRIS